jgi:hypothetical protein
MGGEEMPTSYYTERITYLVCPADSMRSCNELLADSCLEDWIVDGGRFGVEHIDGGTGDDVVLERVR